MSDRCGQRAGEAPNPVVMVSALTNMILALTREVPPARGTNQRIAGSPRLGWR